MCITYIMNFKKCNNKTTIKDSLKISCMWKIFSGWNSSNNGALILFRF